MLAEELKLPFSKEDFIRAAASLELPENAPQTRAKPRVSGILDCARQQGYMMSNTPKSNPEVEDFNRNHQRLTNEIHTQAEDVSIAIIEQLGFSVIDRQIALPDDYPLTGHPDGRLLRSGFAEYPDPEGGQRVIFSEFYQNMPDDLIWGFEHKVIGYLRYVEIFEQGLFKAKPAYVTQSLLYGDALGWDAVLFVILADDAAATKSQRTQALRRKTVPAWAKREDWNPKVQLHAIDLRPLKALVPTFHKRAEVLSQVAQNPAEIKREYSGIANFPCGWCDWKDRCNIDGEGTIEVPTGAFS